MKIAVIIGITSNLGENLCDKLLSKGYYVIGTYFSSNTSKFTENKNVQLYYLNMKDKKNIDNFVSNIKNKDIRIDFFINFVANELLIKKFHTISQEKFEEDMQINVLNQIYLLNNLFPQFSENSNLIFVLSEVTLSNNSSYLSASYTISKFALLGVIKALSIELAFRKVRVNGISPGMMETNFIKNVPNFIKEKYKGLSKSQNLVLVDSVVSEILNILENQSINGENIQIK